MKFYRGYSRILCIHHVSSKGNYVGYIMWDGNWYGPVSWDKNGKCALNESRYDFNGFGPGRQVANMSFSVEKVRPISDLDKE